MPVIINYKICDLAPECGGIEVCPVKAFFWNEKTKRPDVDNSKCISCGLCSLQCPVNAIVMARTEEQYKDLVKRMKADPHTEEELWKERLGCQPGRTAPTSTIVTPENFDKEIMRTKGVMALDVWSLVTVDCRFHSVLWEDLKAPIAFKKIDGGSYLDLTKKLKVEKFPTLLIYKNGREISRIEGYIYQDKLEIIKSKINEAIKK